MVLKDCHNPGRVKRNSEGCSKSSPLTFLAKCLLGNVSAHHWKASSYAAVLGSRAGTNLSVLCGYVIQT